MRWLLYLLLLLVLGSPLWFLAAALEPSPRVVGGEKLSVADVENARQLLRDNDPRRLQDGERREVRLSQRELNLLLNYALPESAAARAAIAGDLIALAASVELPENPFGTYLNGELVLTRSGPALEPVTASLGRLRLPSWLAVQGGRLLSQLLRAQMPEYASAMASLRSLRIEGDALVMEYTWREVLLEQLRARGRDLVLPDELRSSMRAYYDTLAARHPMATDDDSLALPLRDLFREAHRRSLADRDPALENRAALLALGLALSGQDPDLLYEGEWRAPVRIRRANYTLHGRRDLAQHFVVSAVLALSGGKKLADVVGVFKELSDSRGGSGFSFPDLLADRAGVVLAQRSTGSEARSIQQRLAAGGREALFIPPIDALPEGLQDLEFRSRYEDLDTQTYARVEEEIERRIRELDLYRP